MIDLTAMGSTNRDLASVMPGGFIKFSGNESTSKIEYDTKLLFTGSSAATLTLSSDSFQGCNVVISNIGSGNLTVSASFSNSSNSYVLGQGSILYLTFMNGKWHYDNFINADGSEQKVNNVNINGTITGNKLNGTTITGTTITGSGTITGNKVVGTDIVTGNRLNGTTINGSTINGTTINGSTINGSGTITGNKVVGAVWN
jgi:hypothetical protein